MALIRQGVGSRALAKRVCMPRQTAEQWILLYRTGGEAALMGERGSRAYDYETKLAAVVDHVERGLTKAEVMVRHGIANAASLECWCRAYRAGGPDALRPKPRERRRGAGSRSKPSPERERMLEEEVAYLRARVAYLEKVDALLAERSATGRKR